MVSLSTRRGIAVGVVGVRATSDANGPLAGGVGGHECSPREARGSELGLSTAGSSTMRSLLSVPRGVAGGE